MTFIFNPIVPNAPFLYPQRGGRERGKNEERIGKEWVKRLISKFNKSKFFSKITKKIE